MSTFEPHSHVFVDESKARGYFVAAATVSPQHVRSVDQALRQLTRRGQSRIHFSSESDASRRALLDHMKKLRVVVQLYVVRGRSDKDARRLCLEALVADISHSRAARLTLERDDSLVSADRRTIRAALMKHDYAHDLVYQHVSPSEHSALWVSDAIAWCHQAGGTWVARASPLVQGITNLS